MEITVIDMNINLLQYTSRIIKILEYAKAKCMM
jgi:hypothetical protein